MKVRISDIPTAGLKINDTIPLAPLNERMASGRGEDIHFLAAPQLDLTIFKTIDGAETKGSIRSRYRQACSFCLEGVERDLEVETNLYLKPKPRGEADAAYADDVGIIFFEGDHVDLEDIAQETLILSLSLFWHPPADKSGACKVCGINFEAENKRRRSKEPPINKLGDLLKAARPKK